MVLLVSLWVVLIWVLRRRRNHYRREALAELDRIQLAWTKEDSPLTSLPRLPVLIKRAALAAYGREAVASLSGEEWLEFLDGTMTRPWLGPDRRTLLLRCDYASESEQGNLDPDSIRELFDAVRSWLAGHRLPTGE